MSYTPERARLLDIDAEVLAELCEAYDKYTQLSDGFHEAEYDRETERDMADNVASVAAALSWKVRSYVHDQALRIHDGEILEVVKRELDCNAECSDVHSPADLASDVIYRLARVFLADEDPTRRALGIQDI